MDLGPASRRIVDTARTPSLQALRRPRLVGGIAPQVHSPLADRASVRRAGRADLPIGVRRLARQDIRALDLRAMRATGAGDAEGVTVRLTPHPAEARVVPP